MNTMLQEVERPPVIYMEHPVVGIGSPEFQEFAREVIKAIGRMTKKSFKTVAGGLVRVFRYIDRKWTEAGDMHNRAQTSIDERYARNFHHLRCLL